MALALLRRAVLRCRSSIAHAQSDAITSGAASRNRARLKFRILLNESLELRALMAADPFALPEPPTPERQLELPDEIRRCENVENRNELSAFSDRTNQLSQSLLPNGVATQGAYSSQVTQYADSVEDTQKFDRTQATNAAWQDWANAFSSNDSIDSSGHASTSFLATVQPIREITTSWPSERDTQSRDLISESPLSGQPIIDNQSSGFDPSKIWVGANLAGSRQTFGLFQPIDSAGGSIAVDLNRFIGSKSAGISAIGNQDNQSSEGEVGAEPSSLSLPTQNLPKVQLAGAGFQIDRFTPDFTASSVTSEFVGGFTSRTTAANADLKLPGLSWVHTIARVWTGPTQWSITETIVLAFNASITSTITNQRPATPSGSTDNASGIPSHYSSGTGSATLTAS